VLAGEVVQKYQEKQETKTVEKDFAALAPPLKGPPGGSYFTLGVRCGRRKRTPSIEET